MKRVVFLCSRNRRRSPTAERVFADRPGIEVASAGLAADAEEPVTAELLDGAALVLVMERAHLVRLKRRFGAILKTTRTICLDIPDRYAFMDPDLVALLEARAGPHFDRLTGGVPSSGRPSRRRAREGKPRREPPSLDRVERAADGRRHLLGVPGGAGVARGGGAPALEELRPVAPSASRRARPWSKSSTTDAGSSDAGGFAAD